MTTEDKPYDSAESQQNGKECENSCILYHSLDKYTFGRIVKLIFNIHKSYLTLMMPCFSVEMKESITIST